MGKTCPHRSQCLSSEKSRYKELVRSETTDLLERMIERMKDEQNKKQYRKRFGSVEPLFSAMFDPHQGGITRLVLKNNEKVRIEGMLIGLAYVLKQKGIQIGVIFFYFDKYIVFFRTVAW